MYLKKCTGCFAFGVSWEIFCRPWSAATCVGLGVLGGGYNVIHAFLPLVLVLEALEKEELF